MKILASSLFLFIFFTGFGGSEIPFAQATGAKYNHNNDWSGFFPEIAGCERVIQPLVQEGEVFYQTVVYERENYKNNRNQYYVGCGEITLRFEPSARETIKQIVRNIMYFPPVMELKIRNFDAYQNSPLCGNDDSRGSTSVYFDKDKVLIVSANMGAEKILEFAQSADYELMRKSMNKLIKSRTKQK